MSEVEIKGLFHVTRIINCDIAFINDIREVGVMDVSNSMATCSEKELVAEAKSSGFWTHVRAIVSAWENPAAAN
jgi:hypothetical protein